MTLKYSTRLRFNKSKSNETWDVGCKMKLIKSNIKFYLDLNESKVLFVTKTIKNWSFWVSQGFEG
jgi:hypothetical protein